MQPESPLDRRNFIAASSSALLVSSCNVALTNAAPNESKLAIQGGEKTVRETLQTVARWGEPERDQLKAMLGQDSLFYWKGPQTKLFIERFRKVCPLKYAQTCSSGTAALHIAVAAAGIGPGDEVITAEECSVRF